MTLADTDFFIDVMNPKRRHHGAAAAKAEAIERSGGAVFMSAMTRFELAAGVEQYYDPERERARIQPVLRRFPSLPLTNEAADRAGAIQGTLVREGSPIGPLDAMIAALALEHDEVLLTRNQRHFARVQGLAFEVY